MATYLELCQQTLRDSDTDAPEVLTSLQDVDSYHQQVAAFVAEAWRDVQGLHENWGWRQREFKADLKVGTATYEWRELRDGDNERSIPGEPGFRNWTNNPPAGELIWYISSPAQDHANVGPLPQIEFSLMRRRRLSFKSRTRPNAITFLPDKKLEVHPTPDLAYRIYGMHVMGIQTLSNENHIPLGLEGEYHDIIKWKAIMMLHASDEASDSWVFADSQYRGILRSLSRIYLPNLTIGSALI